MKNKQPEYPINKSRLAKNVVKAKKGNSKAFENIVKDTQNYIYYYCLSLLKNEDEASEAVQDIYIILFKKLDSIEKPEAFLGWLKVVSSNYCKNKLARAKEFLTFDEEISVSDNIKYPQISPEQCIETDEICSIVNSAVENLPDFQKECVLMYYYYQMNVSQIAASLGIKEGTVKSRLFNARKAIKSELEKYGKDMLTFEAVSPMAYISYSLLNRSENFKMPVPINIKASIPVGAVDSNSLLSYAVSTIPVTVKSFASIKIIAVVSASALAVGGIAVHTYVHNNPPQNNNSQISAVSQTSPGNTKASQNVQPTQPNTEKPSFPTDETYQLFYSSGFTDEDLRKEITFNPDEDLNSENNKSYVYDRMRNSLDYISTMQGTFYERDKSGNDFFASYQTYCFQMDDLNSKGISYDANGNPVTIDAYDGFLSTSVGFDSDYDNLADAEYDKTLAEKICADRNKYSIVEISQTNHPMKYVFDSRDNVLDYTALVDSRKRNPVIDGEEHRFYRVDIPCLHMASTQYKPEIFADSYLYDFDKWQIDNIGVSFVRECFMISGKANGWLGVYSFSICVDKGNGALISMGGYDANGNEIRNLTTYEYVVDEKLPQGTFEDLENMKKWNF